MKQQIYPIISLRKTTYNNYFGSGLSKHIQGVPKSEGSGLKYQSFKNIILSYSK